MYQVYLSRIPPFLKVDNSSFISQWFDQLLIRSRIKFDLNWSNTVRSQDFISKKKVFRSQRILSAHSSFVDPAVRKRRKLGGGNGSKQFVEGWIEFADKKIAKQV